MAISRRGEVLRFFRTELLGNIVDGVAPREPGVVDRVTDDRIIEVYGRFD